MSGTGTESRAGERGLVGAKQEWVTKKEAARRLGISEKRLQLWVALGLVDTEWIRGHLLIFA